MDATAAKVAADAAGNIIKADPLIGSLLVLALLTCAILATLLYRSWHSCRAEVAAIQDKRIEEVRNLTKALSENATNNADLVQAIKDRTPIQERTASALELLVQDTKSAREGWSHRVGNIEMRLDAIMRKVDR